MFVKICGMTRETDVRHALGSGATALGFILWPRSPRAVSPERVQALVAQVPPGVATVGVFVNESPAQICRIVQETGLTMVQLHGEEPVSYAAQIPVPLLRSVTLQGLEAVAAAWPPQATLLLDAADPVRRGGTGTRVDWERAAALGAARRIVLAGGLTPDNVAEAVETVRPYGVDVSSGVEEAPGVKDVQKVSRFISNARRAFIQAAALRVER